MGNAFAWAGRLMMDSRIRLLVIGMAAALPLIAILWLWGQCGDARQENEELRAQLQKQETVIQNEREENGHCASRLAEVQARAQSLEDRLRELTAKLDLAEAHAKSLSEKEEEERRKNEQLSAAQEQMKAAKDAEISHLHSSLQKTSDDLTQVKTEQQLTREGNGDTTSGGHAAPHALIVKTVAVTIQ